MDNRTTSVNDFAAAKPPQKPRTACTTVGTPRRSNISLQSRNKVFDLSQKVVSRPASVASSNELFSIQRPRSARQPGLLSTPITRRSASPSLISFSSPTEKGKPPLDLNTRLPTNDFFSGPTLCPSPSSPATNQTNAGCFARFTSPKPPKPSSMAFAPTHPRPPQPASLSKPPSAVPVEALSSDSEDDAEIERELANTRQRMLSEMIETSPVIVSPVASQNTMPDDEFIVEDDDEEADVDKYLESENEDVIVPNGDTLVVEEVVDDESEEEVVQEEQVVVVEQDQEEVELNGNSVSNDESAKEEPTSADYMFANQHLIDDVSEDDLVIGNHDDFDRVATPSYPDSSLLSFVLSPGRGARCPKLDMSRPPRDQSDYDVIESDWVKSVLSKVKIEPKLPPTRSVQSVQFRHYSSAPVSPIQKMLESDLMERNLPKTEDMPSLYFR
ncbi:hypothetical protein GEMRC1_007499 [Eukaryota sp. GEM-RC1]